MAFLSASRVGDPALDWGGRALACRERAGHYIEERCHLPLALALPVFPPQSRVAALGIACSTLLAGTGISATSPKPQARKDARIRLRLASSQGVDK